MSPSTEPRPVRTFVAVNLPPPLLAQVTIEQDRIRNAVPPDSVRWTRPEQIHLTLRFFGNVATADLPALQTALRTAVAGLPTFGLGVQGLGCFPSAERPRVIWLGLAGDLDRLQELQGRIETTSGRFGEHEEERAFSPHLTLGRIKAVGAAARSVGKVVREMSVGPLGSWTVEQLELIASELSSTGSRYTCLETVRLSSRA